MTESAVAVRREEPKLTPFEVIERVITAGDLSRMQPAERVDFYWRTCESLGLNPFTRPFEFITLNNRLVMYPRKDATDQLRKINGVTVTGLRRERDDDLGLITVYAGGRDRTGREDEATGVVSVKGLSGDALANALMKAETKAKRRLTLSLVGLGFLDESEVEGAERVDVDPATGEIREAPKAQSLLEKVAAQKAKLATSAATPAEDVEEGVTREDPAAESAPGSAAAQPAAVAPEGAKAEPAAQRASTEAAQPGRCGNPSPYGDGATCALASGHAGLHRELDPDGHGLSSWDAGAGGSGAAQ